MAKRIIKDQSNKMITSLENQEKPNKKVGIFKGLKEMDRKKLFSQIAVVGLILLVTIGAMAQLGLLPHVDNESGKKYGWFGTELAKNSTSLWNPFASPPPNPTLQLSKEYIYAGDRLLAIEEAGGGAPTPTPEPTPDPNATPIPCNENFSDNFNDGVMDHRFWNLSETTPGTSQLNEQNGLLEIQAVPSASGYTKIGYGTKCAYTIRGTTVKMKIASYAGSGTFGRAQLGWGSTNIRIRLSGETIFYKQTGFTYDPAVDVWVRIRHDETSNYIYFESSPDGTTWTTRHSHDLGASYPETYTAGFGLNNGTLSGGTANYNIKFEDFSLENSNN